MSYVGLQENPGKNLQNRGSLFEKFDSMIFLQP